MFWLWPSKKQTRSEESTEPALPVTAVIAVDDNDAEGFAHVSVRPMTYAEVAHITISPDQAPRRIELPADLNDEDDNSDDDASSLDASQASLPAAHPSANVDVLGELEYGDRASLSNATSDKFARRRRHTVMMRGYSWVTKNRSAAHTDKA